MGLLADTTDKTLQLLMLLQMYGEVDYPVFDTEQPKKFMPEHQWELLKKKFDEVYSPKELRALAEGLSEAFKPVLWEDFDDTVESQYLNGYYVELAEKIDNIRLYRVSRNGNTMFHFAYYQRQVVYTQIHQSTMEHLYSVIQKMEDKPDFGAAYETLMLKASKRPIGDLCAIVARNVTREQLAKILEEFDQGGN